MGLTDEYRLEVLSPEGTFKHFRELGGINELRLDGGPRRMEVRGNGDCREATFEGDPVSLGIGPRDIVSVQFRTGPQGVWRNRYAGVAVVSGSADSELGRYKLQGFRMKRLTEVEVRGTLLEMDLGAQVRELFAQLNASGQLGVDGQIGPLLIYPNEPGIPDLGITSAAIDGNFWSVAKLIDERLKGRSRRSQAYLNADGSTESREENPDWGVTADRRPVFGYPSGLLEVDEADEGVEIDGLDVDSTALVTDVRLIWARTLRASYVGLNLGATGSGDTAYDAGQGKPLTRLLNVAAHTYGQAIRSVGVPANAELFKPITGAGVTVGASGGIRSGAPEPLDLTVGVSGDFAALSDGRPDTALTLTRPQDVEPTLYSLTLNLPDGTPRPDGWTIQVSGGRVETLKLAGQAGGNSIRVTVDGPSGSTGGLYLLPGPVRDALENRWASQLTTTFLIRVDDPNMPVVLTAATLVYADPELMLATVGPLARLPIQNPVTVRLPGWETDPAPKIKITRRSLTGAVTLVRELPVDLIVYDVDDDGELYTEVRCGQSDDAEKLSFATAITSKDQAATLDAVRAV